MGIIAEELKGQARVKKPVLIRLARPPHLFCFFIVHAPPPPASEGIDSMDSEVIPNASNGYPNLTPNHGHFLSQIQQG